MDRVKEKEHSGREQGSLTEEAHAGFYFPSFKEINKCPRGQRRPSPLCIKKRLFQESGVPSNKLKNKSIVNGAAYICALANKSHESLVI